MVKSDATTVEGYLAEMPPERRVALESVRQAVLSNLPDGYIETMQYGMISYVIPMDKVGKTYNNQPLALASLGNQKNYMTLYLNNVYGDPELEQWFVRAFNATGKKLNMGKSCVRFKDLDDLPLDIIGQAIASTPVNRMIERYQAVKRTTHH